MSAGYIMWEYECTHVFGNATRSNMIRKNCSSRKCVYRVYSVRYVESMFLYCPNQINKQKVRKILAVHYKISNTEGLIGRKKCSALGSRQPFEI